MDAVILCAGKGKRISKYISNSQKCMIPIQGKPIIYHTFKHFESVGIDTIYFIIGYKSQEVINYFFKIKRKTKIEFLLDEQFEVDSTSRSLLLAEEFISSDFICSYGEIFYKKSLIDKIIKNEFKETSAIIAISENLNIAPTHPKIKIVDNKINKIDLHSSKKENKNYFSYMGIMRSNKDIFYYLKKAHKIPCALDKMIKEGKNIRYIIYKDEWKHFATKKDLLEQNE